MSWLLGKIKWLLLVAMIGGPFISYLGWEDKQRILNVQENGVETTALIEGATRKKKRRRSERFSVDLAWQDAQGNVRKAKGISIDSDLAATLIKDDKIVVDALPIKYLEGDRTSRPVIMHDVPGQIESSDMMLKLGAGGGALGFLGSLGGFLWGRRRKSAEV